MKTARKTAAKTLGLVLTGAAIAVAATIGVHWFLARKTGHALAAWSDSIQASVTILLVAITALYAYYTWQLVHAQTNPRKALQVVMWHQATREISAITIRAQAELKSIGDRIGVPIHVEQRTPDLRSGDLQGLDALIGQLQTSLPEVPSTLTEPSSTCVASLSKATEGLGALAEAITCARADSAEPSMEDVRRCFEAQEPAPETSWDGLIAGTDPSSAQRAVEQLADACRAQLRR